MVGHAVARIVVRTEEAVMRIRMVKLGFEHVKDSTDAAYKRIIEWLVVPVLRYNSHAS